MTEIGVYDARSQLSRLIDRALQGEEVVITRKGKPVVRLAPVQEDNPRTRYAGALRGKIEIPDSFFDPLPEDVLELFHGDRRD